MEEHREIPPGINSVYVAKALQARLSYLDRKRKFQGEQLGIPPPKHVCSDQTYALTYDFSSTPNPEDQVLYGLIVKPEWTRMTGAEELEEEESAKDSNSVCADSMISVSGAAEYQCQSEEYLFDQPSTSSVSSRGNISKNPMHYSETTSATKSSDKIETEHINDLNYPDSGLHASVNDEDYLLEFGGQMDFSCSEDTTSFEDCTDKEPENMLYNNGVAPNYVLSSGRWTINQDTQQRPKKLTIDKEFEQYFSTLML